MLFHCHLKILPFSQSEKKIEHQKRQYVNKDTYNERQAEKIEEIDIKIDIERKEK